MQTRIIEATDATSFNHGKFMVSRFTDEWMVRSSIDPDRPLLSSVCGWSPDHLHVLDLQTGEGAIFRPCGYAKADLDKHSIWVCPMFEPFLEWLYRQDLSDIEKLPALVNLGDVPTAMYGHRRNGRDE